VIDLCADCIADVMNSSPNDVEFVNDKNERVYPSIPQRAQMLEQVAEGQTPAFMPQRPNGSLFPSMKGITIVNGARMCAYHAADRRWNHR